MGLLSLIVRIGADGRQFKAGLREAGIAAENWGRQLKGQIAGAFSAAATIAFFRSIEQTASRIKDLSAQFNLSTDDVQRFDFALKKDGLSAEDLGQALIRLGQARRKAVEGDKEATKLLKRYGISLNEASDDSIENIEVLKKMKAVMDSGNLSVKDRIELFDLLGKSGEKLINSLRAQKGDEGIFFRKADLDTIDEASEKLQEFWGRLKGAVGRDIGQFIRNPLRLLFGQGLGLRQEEEEIARRQKSQASGSGLMNTLTGFFSGRNYPGDTSRDTKLLEDRKELMEKIAKIHRDILGDTEREQMLRAEINQRIKVAEGAGSDTPEGRRLQQEVLGEAADLVAQLSQIKGTQPFKFNLNDLQRIGGYLGPGSEKVQMFQTGQEIKRDVKSILGELKRISPSLKTDIF